MLMRDPVHLQYKALSLTCGEAPLCQMCVTGALLKRRTYQGEMDEKICQLRNDKMRGEEKHRGGCQGQGV